MKLKTTKGFTVIELLTSMTIFTIIIGVCVTIFINALKNQRIVVNLMAVNDNVSQTIEQITREIRAGSNFSTSNGNDISFTNSRLESVSYRVNSSTNSLEKGVNGTFAPITADNVIIKNFIIMLRGAAPGDGAAPRVTLSITASGRLKELLTTDLTLQTTVSARNINN